MIVKILQGTPTPVWVLCIVLLTLGLRQRHARRIGRRRALLLPAVMVLLSLANALSLFGAGAMLAWGAAAALAAMLVMRQPLPAETAYHVATDCFDLPGSNVPLLLMMSMFCLNYALKVGMAMAPALGHNVPAALVICAVSGGLSGVFAGRAARLWRLAAASAANSASPATPDSII